MMSITLEETRSFSFAMENERYSGEIGQGGSIPTRGPHMAGSCFGRDITPTRDALLAVELGKLGRLGRYKLVGLYVYSLPY